MGVKGDGAFFPTESIVSKRARKHYRVPVRSQHWQLRSLISVEKRNLIYFPGGSGSNHVQRLDTTTHEYETIKLLTFAPRCLVADNGWLCCGSENGEFVAIRLNEDNQNSSPNISLDLDSESRSNLGLDSSREDSLLSLLAQARRSNKSLIAKSIKLADDRVNCITLWFPPTAFATGQEAYTEPVAVLANNDKTVKLVSLREFDQNEETEALDVVTYPDFVNRAIISPDGRLLIAILDDPYLYVHVRTPKTAEAPSRPSSKSYEWQQIQRLLLKSQDRDDKSDSRGSFAACFSKSGSFLAVGTQHGTISVFNTELFYDSSANPLVTTFTSSQPEIGAGAIRDMAFSPGPFDILAWTEDRGHIGIADVRTNFVTQQIVDINAEDDFEHISVFDRNTIDPRLLDGQQDRREVSRGLQSSTVSSARREGLNTLNTPLTTDETMVLEAIQGDRRRRERVAAETQRASETGDLRTYMSSLRPQDGEANTQHNTRQRSSSVGRAVGDLLGTYRDQRERAQERVRTTRQLMRDAVQGRPGPPPRRADRDPGWMDRLGETVAAMRDQRERQDSSYLNVLEILQARERSSNDAQHDESLLVPLVNQVVNRWEESAIRGTLPPDHGVFEVPPSPDNTAGISWSEDGRILFVGAQNGIYELHINVHNRRIYPSLKMR